MKNTRIDIGTIRREQIVDAAVGIIAERGLQNLSLSEIEKRAGMTRGHLTYYFPAKEEILLAVFDRLLQLLCDQHRAAGQGPEALQEASIVDALRVVLLAIMKNPPANPEFHALQYTFLSQIGHREDFRQRLASLYEDWRIQGAQHLTNERNKGQTKRDVPPRAMASLIQAIFHGLAMQLAADPNAFDRDEMIELCLDMIGTYLKVKPASPDKSNQGNGKGAYHRPHSDKARRHVSAKR